MARRRRSARPGLTRRRAWNFALYSTEATAVRLLIYGAGDFVRPLKSYDLDARLNKTIRVWHVLVPAAEVPGAAYYAFKVSGPNDPAGACSSMPARFCSILMRAGSSCRPHFSRAAATAAGPQRWHGAAGNSPAKWRQFRPEWRR